MTSLCFVAGDPSGDAHASRLIEALKRKTPGLTFSGLGGKAMRAAGASLLDDLTQTAAIGPFDAARHLSKFIHAKRLLDNHLRNQRPDLVVLVDFGDFNLPFIAPLVKRYNIPIVYYISPQLWAWGRFRLHFVRKYVDHMIVFFPFEETFYQKAGVPVTWVGHPLLDLAQADKSADAVKKECDLSDGQRAVGLLPGSRSHEIQRHLPLMLEAAKLVSQKVSDIQWIIPKAASISSESLQAHTKKHDLSVQIVEGPLYDYLQIMDAAIVCSGTATLETALFGVPMVVVYKTSWPTYFLVRSVLRIPNIAMVNILAKRKLVEELIQDKAHPQQIAKSLLELLQDANKSADMRTQLGEVTKTLGTPGAVDRAAAVVLKMLNR